MDNVGPDQRLHCPHTESMNTVVYVDKQCMFACDKGLFPYFASCVLMLMHNGRKGPYAIRAFYQIMHHGFLCRCTEEGNYELVQSD